MTSQLQSFAMSVAIKVVLVFLVCFVAANTATAPFPHGRTVVYKYYGDVEAGTIEPARYASRFALEGTLYVQHDKSDPALKYAYNVALANISTGMRNGEVSYSERVQVLTSTNDATTTMQEPFLIVYDDHGKLEGVKISPNESAWSKNMKMALASMLQLDLPAMEIEKRKQPRSFITKENTIYGDCAVSYDVRVKDQLHRNDNVITVTKFSSPRDCNGFAIHEFDLEDDLGCQAPNEEPMNFASRRLFEIEKQGKDIVINKLVAHGGANYLPWSARSEAHYVLTNTTLSLENVVLVSELNLRAVNFVDVPMIRDLTYQNTGGSYAVDTAVDITEGRHVVDLDITMFKIKRTMHEAAEYLTRDQLRTNKPGWISRRILERILQMMSYLDVEYLGMIFDAYEHGDTPNTPEYAAIARNILHGMLPQVGTTASCRFILSLVRDRKISEPKMIEMLAKLPIHVRKPSVELLEQMDGLINHDETRSIIVQRAGVLCFSSLVYRTFKDIPNPEANPILQRYIRHFLDHINNGTNYDKKVGNLMALKNIQVGKIYEHLAPIIRGEVTVPEFPVDFRVLAIWAIDKSIESDYQYARDLLWPVMADKSLPVKLRITAYEILMNQATSMTDVLRIYWFMVYETNEHLYNYHYTTIKAIASSVDPCNRRLRELAKKVLRFTRIHNNVRYTRCTAYTFDHQDDKYNRGQKLHAGIIVDELTGIPEILHLQQIVTDGRKSVSEFEVRVHVEGGDETISWLTRGQVPSGKTYDKNVREVLDEAAKDMPLAWKPFRMTIVIMRKGRVVLANYYDHITGDSVARDIEKLFMQLTEPASGQVSLSHQMILYDVLREKQVTSDMGIPIVFENHVPHVFSANINYNISRIKLDTKIDLKLWSQRDYSMSIYNPLADLWHSIRRSTITDVSIPIRFSMVRAMGNIKYSFPGRLVSSLVSAGIRTEAKDFVDVIGDEPDQLTKSCPSCNRHEEVSLGATKKKHYETSFDSKDIGLQLSAAIFDCESGVTPVTLSKEWHKIFMSDDKNDWNSGFVRVALAISQQLQNMLNSPEVGSCGKLLKIEPSTVYPTSRVEVVLDRDPEYGLRGTVNAIAAATNISARSWELKVNLDSTNQGHLTNVPKIKLTRKTPGETNLKICADGKKSYPASPMDPLNLDYTGQVANTALTIAIGRTNEEECVSDDTLIDITVEGQLSDDQKQLFSREVVNGSCSNDVKNPLYANPKNLVPKTLNCLEEVMRHTTLRNYTIHLKHRKVPQDIKSKIQILDDIIRVYLLPNLKYTVAHVETENIKINAEYPVQKEAVDISVATSTHTYEIVDVDFEEPPFNGFGPVVHPVWHLPLDNTRFDLESLLKYSYGMLKMCSIYPKTVLTGDGQNIAFNVPEQWTLVTGDHVAKSFAVFAKTVGNNLAVKICADDYCMDIIPNADNSVKVFVNGRVINLTEETIRVPDYVYAWTLKIKKSNDHVLVLVKRMEMKVFHGINHVAIAMGTILQGRVSGLCGHLNGTALYGIPKVYTLYGRYKGRW